MRILPAMSLRPEDSRLPLRVAGAVGLVAGCVLALQVLLTRIFGAVLFYHFGFLAISLALLGAGGGAIAVYVRPQWFPAERLEWLLARWCAVFSLLLVAVPLALVRLDYTFHSTVTVGFVAVLALACLLAALPFTAGGIVIALAVRGYTSSIGKLYAFDLAGAGIGALAVVPVLWLVDAPTLVVALGVIAAVAAVLFNGAGSLRAVTLGVLGVAAVAVALSAATNLYYLPPHVSVLPGSKPVADRWTPLNRVLGYPPPKGSRFAPLFYDRVYAPVPVWHPGTPLPNWRALKLGPQSVGYALSHHGRALVIGGGGGRDIENALTSGMHQVDVIELNRAMRDVADGPLRQYSGSPYTLPGVSVKFGDGRTTLAARKTKYDEIHIGFTDTLSANSAAAFALSEANLYTVQAFEDYFDHLNPGGILNVTRLRHLVGDEALRATILTLDALEKRGVDHPERNVVVLLGKDIFGEVYGTVLARETPWTPAELARIRTLAAQRGDGVAYAPGGPYKLEWAQLARAPSWQEFCSHYRLDVCPPTDDKPFFFQMTRLSHVGQATPPGYFFSVDPFYILLITLGILLVLCAFAFALPLFVVRREARPPLSSLVFFAAIGLGFLLMEIALIQRFVLFLGFPTYALSVVLFSLLVFTGIGSLISTRLGNPRRTLLAALGLATVLIAASAYGLQPLLRQWISIAFAGRVAITVALLAPLGISLGMAMPIGLTRISRLYPGSVVWAWGINGVASVLASVLAVAVAITWGFPLTTLLACACYLVALGHAALGRWPAGDVRQQVRFPAPRSSGTPAASSSARR
jgi:hypothetical protein